MYVVADIDSLFVCSDFRAQKHRQNLQSSKWLLFFGDSVFKFFLVIFWSNCRHSYNTVLTNHGHGSRTENSSCWFNAHLSAGAGWNSTKSHQPNLSFRCLRFMFFHLYHIVLWQTLTEESLQRQIISFQAGCGRPTRSCPAGLGRVRSWSFSVQTGRVHSGEVSFKNHRHCDDRHVATFCVERYCISKVSVEFSEIYASL